MQQQSPSNYSRSLSKSLTIDEMRDLHRQALSEAESKKTELRLVLASRYRELVGSSDEVSTMSRDASVLQDLVCQLPSLVDDLILSVQGEKSMDTNNARVKDREESKNRESEDNDAANVKNDLIVDRMKLSVAPRIIHSCLDQKNVHGATSALIDTFEIIAKYSDNYQLVNEIIKNGGSSVVISITPNSLSSQDVKMLYTQIKMVYFHLQTLPLHIIHLSKQILIGSTDISDVSNLIVTSTQSAHGTARALSALHRLNVSFFKFNESTRANKLLDMYFDAKAKTIHALLEKLGSRSISKKNNTGNDDSTKGKISTVHKAVDDTDAAESIISQIVSILQHDIILYPYQIFVLRRYALSEANAYENVDNVINKLPIFDQEQIKNKASSFLAAHLPLVRTKVKAVLVGIAGTTACRLGSIRQSLYDKTDGSACIASLSSDGICTWDDAVQNMVDLKIVTRALDGLSSTSTDNTATIGVNAKASGRNTNITFTNTSTQRKFSFWGTLFSNTFSSLVHSILSTSFHSVHLQVVTTLRASLANAPSLTKILPHEAYRNTLRIATELDAALKKVSDDAHELLVHAEEREESERRLKQSLYVQTCEIMGRLLNELRRMLLPISGNEKDIQDDDDATKELIVGRLCYLLKFRLTSLPKLLDPNSSPAILSSRPGGKVGMITVAELQSAFEIADVDDDGLINFEEAMEAMDGAFSGTQFHGAEMVRDTMLLTSGTDDKASTNVGSRATPKNLTLSELTLLSARGLRHDINGPGSSLGTIQSTLDSIVQTCFARWATSALSPHTKLFMNSWAEAMDVSLATSDDEWKRLHAFNATAQDLLHEEISEVLQNEEVTTETVKIGCVSSFIVSYLISASALLNKSICPSDSLAPFPSNDYASAMGISVPSDSMTMVDTLRSCLLIESFSSMSNAVYKFVLDSHNVDEESKLNDFSPSALIQLLLDVKFVSDCFFKRNNYDLLRASNSQERRESIVNVKENLNESEAFVLSLARERAQTFEVDDCVAMFDSRYSTVYNSCSMFLTSILGEDHAASASNKENEEDVTTHKDVPSLIINPIPSSRRFTLLPIQAEQSVKELQLIRNLEKERAEKAESEKMGGASAAASAVSSGIGYISSFLKKK